MNDDVHEWLLDSDPALRWQVERDLLHRPEDQWGSSYLRWVGGDTPGERGGLR